MGKGEIEIDIHTSAADGNRGDVIVLRVVYIGVDV